MANSSPSTIIPSSPPPVYTNRYANNADAIVKRLVAAGMGNEYAKQIVNQCANGGFPTGLSMPQQFALGWL